MCTRLFGLRLENAFACRENQGMHMTEEQLSFLHLIFMQLESDPLGATLGIVQQKIFTL